MYTSKGARNLHHLDAKWLAKLQAGDEVVPAYEAIDLLQEVLCVESGGK